jgi:hypothetical protein
MEAMMVNMALRTWVEVSRASWCEMKSMPSDRNSSNARTNCFVLRAKAIEAEDHDHVEGSAARVSHQRVKTRTPFLAYAGSVRVNAGSCQRR